METFVAIDFETAVGQDSPCAVGIVTVENGIKTEEFYTLIQPPGNRYTRYTIAVHGITPNDTINSPLFIDVYPEIEKRLKNRTVVAHNAVFDRNVLQKTMQANRLDYSALNLSDWECTMQLCRSIDKYPSGKLDECCEVEGIELNHHEALSDARACAELFLIVSQ